MLYSDLKRDIKNESNFQSPLLIRWRRDGVLTRDGENCRLKVGDLQVACWVFRAVYLMQSGFVIVLPAMYYLPDSPREPVWEWRMELVSQNVLQRCNLEIQSILWDHWTTSLGTCFHDIVLHIHRYLKEKELKATDCFVLAPNKALPVKILLWNVCNLCALL